MLGFRRILMAAVMFAVCAIGSNAAQAQFFDFFGIGSVYTASNQPDGNSVQTYLRLPQGGLIPFGSADTGGLGTGGGLGNQGGMTLSDNGRWLLAVNAGDNTVSVFFVGLLGELYLTDVEPSGGDLPVSVTIDGRTVYVLNGAGAGSIQGFELSFFGNLSPIADSNRPLSGADTTAPAQIQFSTDGAQLVVTEKATDLIDVYQLDADNIAQGPNTQESNGMTPFGFDFTRGNRLIVSEAVGGMPGASTVSSYALQADGVLQTISESVPDNQTAACWIEILANGRFAYTTNTASGNVSGYAVNPATGALTLLGDGNTGSTGEGSGPIDIAATGNSRFIYVLNSGTQEIVGFRVRANGSLTPVTTVSGLPAGANGLLAR